MACRPGHDHEWYTDRSIGGDGQTRCRKCGAEPFQPCPLASERGTEDECQGIDAANLTVGVAKDPWSTVEYHACQACATAYANQCEDQ